MNQEEIYYTAYFINNPEDLMRLFPPKHNNIYYHHVTKKYKPKNLDGLNLGKKTMLKIVGRVFDDRGDALLVDGVESDNKFPHITLSCIDGVPPFYSDQLLKKSSLDNEIVMLDEPCYIEATEGYVDNSKVIKLSK